MSEKLVDLSQIARFNRYLTDFSRFGENYIFSHITPQDETSPFDMSMPMRFGGLMFVLCLDGDISVDINLNTYHITAGMVAITGPDAIVKVNSVEWKTLDAYSLFVSPEFIRDINIDINVFGQRMYSHPRSPLFKLSPEEMNLLKRYLELLHLNAKENAEDVYSKNISRCLLASVLYQMMRFVVKRKEEVEEEPATFSRRMNYVQEFVRLVHTFHRSERSVGFYAGKLFISPKYLSLIVKEATGRSAAEWIDEYVILEAKNMLRFSGKNIQQVAYDLNFTSQSSFGKYFKHLTGMSPSEFMKK